MLIDRKNINGTMMCNPTTQFKVNAKCSYFTDEFNPGPSLPLAGQSTYRCNKEKNKLPEGVKLLANDFM